MNSLRCIFLFIFFSSQYYDCVCLFGLDAGEDWAFATKLADLSENMDDENENAFPDLEIFQVKFLGSSTVNAAKSEEATANAIKSIISTAKGDCPFLSLKCFH